MTEVERIPTVLDSSMAQVGEVYARALLAEGQQHNKVDRLVDELSQFGKVLHDLPKLQAMLESPKISYETKAGLIDKCLKGKADTSMLNFVKLLAKRGRFECYRAVEFAARELQDEMAGRVRALVTSASELNNDAKSQLEKRLSTMLGKNVVATVKIDPAIIGGVVVRVGDTVYDMSVANRLEQIKAKAVKGVTDSIRQSFSRFAADN